jgi:hypothetical protein
MPHNSTIAKPGLVEKTCKCGTLFYVHPYRVELAKYCKYSCVNRGRPAWSKGTKGVVKPNRTSFKSVAEERHPRWLGDDVGYSALHDWVAKHLGTPDVCTQCGKNNLTGRRIHWANISHEYKRDLTDWARLCASCHKLYDLNKIELEINRGR